RRWGPRRPKRSPRQAGPRTARGQGNRLISSPSAFGPFPSGGWRGNRVAHVVVAEAAESGHEPTGRGGGLAEGECLMPAELADGLALGAERSSRITVRFAPTTRALRLPGRQSGSSARSKVSDDAERHRKAASPACR